MPGPNWSIRAPRARRSLAGRRRCCSRNYAVVTVGGWQLTGTWWRRGFPLHAPTAKKSQRTWYIGYKSVQQPPRKEERHSGGRRPLCRFFTRNRWRRWRMPATLGSYERHVPHNNNNNNSNIISQLALGPNVQRSQGLVQCFRAPVSVG